MPAVNSKSHIYVINITRYPPFHIPYSMAAKGKDLDAEKSDRHAEDGGE